MGGVATLQVLVSWSVCGGVDVLLVEERLINAKSHNIYHTRILATVKARVLSAKSLVGLTRMVSTLGKYLSTSWRMKSLPVKRSRTFGSSLTIACRAERRPVQCAARDLSKPPIHKTTHCRCPITIFSILRSSEASGPTQPKCLSSHLRKPCVHPPGFLRSLSTA